MSTIKKWKTLVKKKKMSKNIFAILLLFLWATIAIAWLIPGNRPKTIKSKDTSHNIIIKFNGNDKNIPKDGQLLLIKCSLEDTLIVEPASLDDCRRILEENGEG